MGKTGRLVRGGVLGLIFFSQTSLATTCLRLVPEALPEERPLVYVIMAISSMGKSTQGAKLAEYLNVPFYEPDDFHPPENRRKISEGLSLTDDERWPWLDAMREQVIQRHLALGAGAVMANSALRKAYRQRLGLPHKRVQLIYLRGTKEIAIANNSSRVGHFAPLQTVLNNLAILEEPEPEENAIVVDVDPVGGAEGTFRRLLKALGLE